MLKRSSTALKVNPRNPLQAPQDLPLPDRHPNTPASEKPLFFPTEKTTHRSTCPILQSPFVLMPAGMPATAIPTGTIFQFCHEPRRGNCHGAEPTLFPAFYQATGMYPAIARGGPPGFPHTTAPLSPPAPLRPPPIITYSQKQSARASAPALCRICIILSIHFQKKE